jgi:hypothetical protein
MKKLLPISSCYQCYYFVHNNWPCHCKLSGIDKYDFEFPEWCKLKNEENHEQQKQSDSPL